MASFPTSVVALTNPNSGDALTSPSHASQHANANDEIEAIETVLGITTTGSQRLPGYGTSFPGSPATGQKFWRSDLSLGFFFNGARWLSETLFSEPIGYCDAFAATGDMTLDRVPGDAGNPAGFQIEEWHYAFYINGGTALSASHKWDVTLKSFVSTGTARAVVTIDSGASSTWRNLATTGVATPLSGITMYQVTATKTGTPGNLAGIGRMVYRRIAT